MACGARSGLKPLSSCGSLLDYGRLNGLWSPFGIETYGLDVKDLWVSAAKWPVEPVRD